MISMKRNGNTYFISYEDGEKFGGKLIEFRTYDLLKFMNWLEDLYRRDLILTQKFYIEEQEYGTLVYLGEENLPWKSFLIHRTYMWHKDVEDIVEIFNKYY